MKKVFVKILCFALFLCLIVEPICAFSAENDTEQKCNLEMIYSKNGVVFSELKIRIFRVADENFTKVAPFENYPVDVENVKSQTEWSKVATTVSGYVNLDNISPYKSLVTDSEGKVKFEGIEKGLYLVSGVVAEKNNRVYTFFDSMIFMPAVSENGNSYDVSIKPKSVEITLAEKTFSVVKLWQDEGNSNNRPENVTVDIVKDGIVMETVKLNSKNNWRYTFKTADVKSKWSVVEKNVPAGYTVTVTEKETSFVIVNTKKTPTNPDKPSTNVPPTGDNTRIDLYILIFCISGLLIIILGFGMRKKENAS